MSSKKTMFTTVAAEDVEYKIVQMFLDQLVGHSLDICVNTKYYCEDYGDRQHLTYQCKHCRNPILASYNNYKCNASLEVIQFVILMGIGEMINRLEDIEVRGRALNKMYYELEDLEVYCNKILVTMHW